MSSDYIASRELIETMIQQNELELMRMGSTPPADPDRVEDWRKRRERLLRELEMFRNRLATLINPYTGKPYPGE